MATKPVNNIPEWADGSNAGNYTGGPFAGQPRKVSIPGALAAEGFRPGADDPTAAEHINDWLNQAALKLRWVHSGTATAVAEATIVERSATGTIAAQQGVFESSLVANIASLESRSPAGGHALSLYAGEANASSLLTMTHEGDGLGFDFGGGPLGQATCSGDSIVGLSIAMTGTTNADALVVTTNGLGCDGVRSVVSGQASYALYGQVNSATSVAVQGLAVDNGIGARFYGGFASGVGCLVESTADNGVLATGGNSPTTAAVKATGKASAPGVIAVGGPTAGAPGVAATGGAGGGLGVRGTGTGTEAGVEGTGAVGVDCYSTSVSGSALRAYSHVAATTGAAVFAIGQAAGDAVVALATGSGIGFRATSGSGAAAAFTCSGANNAARFIAAGAAPTTVHVARAADPTSHEDGGMWYRTNFGHSVRRGGVTRRLYDTAGGMAYAYGFTAAGTVNTVATTIVSASFSGANVPVAVGKVLVRVAFELGRNSGTPNARISVFDQTLEVAIVISLETILLFQAGGAGVYERTMAYELEYTLPAAGARTFTVELESTPAGVINYRNLSLVVLGVF